MVGEKTSLGKAIELVEEAFLTRHNKGLYRIVIEAIEKPLIENILNRTEGNQLKAAKILGINRNTLHSKIKKFGIEARRWKR